MRPDSIAYGHAIKTLYERDPRRLGANARRRAEQHWDWNDAMSALLARYTRLASNRAASWPPAAHTANHQT